MPPRNQIQKAHIVKFFSSTRSKAAAALGIALLLPILVAPVAHAASLDPANKVDELVLTPANIDGNSIDDWFDEQNGVIASKNGKACPTPGVLPYRTNMQFVLPDGEVIPSSGLLSYPEILGFSAGDGKPVNLNKENSLSEQFSSIWFVFATLEEVKSDEVELVYVCHNVGKRHPDNAYFSVKLERTGTGWRAVAGEPSAAPTATAFTASSSRVNGKVDFVASVTAGEALVSGGTVDFVVDGTDTRIATGTVTAGKATATSENAVDPTDGLNVKAVYRGVSGFAASESAPQRVFGVRVPAPGSGDGDVTVVVPERDTPAGSVKFTAAATADLGEAVWTANGLSAIGSIAGAVVVDSRIDKSATWTVNGVADKFKTQTPASGSKVNEIPAAALSWVPAVKKGTTLPAGATVGAGAALGSPQTLLRWAQGGSGAGELKSEVGAELKLNAEGDFVAGNYSAKITLTLV